jgi:hypothetical protein
MLLQIRTVREEAVMCTVQACSRVARYVFTGIIDTDTGSPGMVAVYCDPHAAEEARRLGHPWPLGEQHTRKTKARAQSA